MKGKYDSFRDSALHFLCNAGWGNESDGNAPEYGSYFTRITLDWEDVKPTNSEFNSLIEDWDTYEEADGSSELFRRTLVGHWIVAEGSSGGVTVRGFVSEPQAKARFNAFAEHYSRWQDSGDRS